jgi:hypothetical protein
MKILITQAQITQDGFLRLEIPCDLTPGDVKVVMMIQSKELEPSENNQMPCSLRGIWVGKLPDIDIDADLNDLNQMWKRSLEIPE